MRMYNRVCNSLLDGCEHSALLGRDLVLELIQNASPVPEIKTDLHLDRSLALPIPILSYLIGEIEELIRWRKRKAGKDLKIDLGLRVGPESSVGLTIAM